MEKLQFQSRVISVLKFTLMLGVVCIHCRFTMALQPTIMQFIIDNDVANEGGNLLIYSNVSYLFSKSLFGLCVPVFFILSGYLFFYNISFGVRSLFQKLRKRIKTILIPFVLWNLLYVFFWWAVKPDVAADYVPWQPISSGSIGKDFYHWFYSCFVDCNGWGSPTDIPFWYLRDLICMFILSPFVYYTMKYTRGVGLLLLVTGFVLCGGVSSFPLLIPIRPAVLFFFIGAYYAINKKNIVLELNRLPNSLFILYIILIVIDVIYKGSGIGKYIHQLTILIGIPCVVKIVSLIVNSHRRIHTTLLRIYDRIEQTQFFIFASHWAVLYLLSQPLSVLIGHNLDVSLVLLYFIQFIVSVLITITLGVILNILMPKAMKILNGR